MVVQLGGCSARSAQPGIGQRPGGNTERLRIWTSASCCLFFLSCPRLSLYGASVTELHFLMFCEAPADDVTFGACQGPPPTYPHILCNGRCTQKLQPALALYDQASVEELTSVAGWHSSVWSSPAVARIQEIEED